MNKNNLAQIQRIHMMKIKHSCYGNRSQLGMWSWQIYVINGVHKKVHLILHFDLYCASTHISMHPHYNVNNLPGDDTLNTLQMAVTTKKYFQKIRTHEVELHNATLMWNISELVVYILLRTKHHALTNLLLNSYLTADCKQFTLQNIHSRYRPETRTSFFISRIPFAVITE